MKLGVVIGKAISNRKEGNLDGCKLLVVHYLNKNLEPSDNYAACVDTVNAGDGDMVIVCSSSSARKTAITKDVATDSTIIGIVDTITFNKQSLYKK